MNLSIPFFQRNKLFVFLILLCSCQPSATVVNNKGIDNPPLRQGIQVTTLFKEGDFDPNGDIKKNGSIYGTPRMVYIYESTNLKAAELGENDFVKNIFTHLIDSVMTDENGKAFVKIGEGKYSLFVQENERLYSKLNDRNLFWPVEVKKDSVTTVVIEIDYKANY